MTPSPDLNKPLLKEIQDAHSALSPAAQEVIKRAMPGVAPMLPGGAEAPNVAPTLKPIGAPPPQAPSLVQKPQPTPTQTELSRITAPPKLDANGAVIHNKTNTGLPGVGQIESPFKRTLATIGDVIGSSLFPGIARNIPGTSAHHALLVNEREQEANDESKRGLESTQATEAQARADEAEANARAKANPADKMLTVKADEGVFDANTGKWTVEPKAKTADTIEISAEKGKALGLVPTADGRYLLPKEGTGPFLTATAKPEKTPTNAFELWQKQNPHGTAEDWLKIETANKPEAANEYRDFKDGYLKKHPQAGMDDIARAFAETKKIESPDAANAALDREIGHFGKSYETASAAARAQLEKIDEAESMVSGKNPEVQALGIPKVLTALISGQGTGVRITQAELNAIANARGVAGGFEGWWNKITGKGQLTADQQKQLVGILEDVKARVLQKQTIASGALDKINGARSRQEIIAADKEARTALDGLEKGGQGGQAIRARDPQGKLHEAPAGTKLPTGWKLEH